MDSLCKGWTLLKGVPWENVVEFLKSFVLPGAAVYVAWKFGAIQAAISRQQATTAAEAAKIAKNQLRLQVMGERIKVYDAARSLIGAVSQRSKLLPADEMTYLAGIQGSRWLFGEDVNTYLHETLWRRMNSLHLTTSLLDEELDGDVRETLRTRKLDELNWFNDQYKELDRVLAPYLKIDDA